MDDTFKIFVYRLRDGQQEKITERLSPDFLEVSESSLSFISPVEIKGTATLADDVLVLELAVETEAVMPCAVCNQNTSVKISIPHFCYTESLSDIKGSVFNYKNALREGILLEVPFTAECNGGDCPERADLAQYLSQKEGD